MSLGSTIVFGSNSKNRDAVINSMLVRLNPSYINREHPDLMYITDSVNKNSIGIAQIKKAISFLSIKPYSGLYKIVVVEKADKLTGQAQNALLKTLEEPPSYAVIVLSAKTEESLLPTVISRCKKIDTSERAQAEIHEDVRGKYLKIVSSPMGERLDTAEELSKEEKDEIVEILKNMIVVERNRMVSDPQKIYADNIGLLTDAVKDLEDTNVNTRLCLENLFLHLC